MRSRPVSAEAEVLLHHGRGFSRSSPLMVQVRSIWVVRDGVGLVCSVLGLLGGIVSKPWVPARLVLGGALGCWILCWALLCFWKRIEDNLCEFDEDERADRSAGPTMMGLGGAALSSAVGWSVGYVSVMVG